MATRVFADEELQRLREFPEISRDELYRYFTLTPADLAFVAPQGRGAGVRLGLSVILCSLPWLGFVPDKVVSAPPVAVARLAEQLNVDATQLRSYGRRAQTRSEHLRLVAQYLGWRLSSVASVFEIGLSRGDDCVVCGDPSDPSSLEVDLAVSSDSELVRGGQTKPAVLVSLPTPLGEDRSVHRVRAGRR